MGSVRQPEDERIPVAAPRPARHERSPRRRLVDASGAGLTLIVIIAAFALLGAWAGSTIGIPIAGALALGFLGLLAGFAGIYWRYRDL